MWELSIIPSWSLTSIDPEKGNVENSMVSKCFDFLPNITENHIKNTSRWEDTLTFSQKWTSDGSFLNDTWMNVCSERWNDLIKAIYPASSKAELPCGSWPPLPAHPAVWTPLLGTVVSGGVVRGPSHSVSSGKDSSAPGALPSIF